MSDKIEWKDATTYSRGDRERKPTSFSIKSGALRIVVMKGHRDYPGEWVMHAYGLGIDTEPLGLSADEPVGKAQMEAIKVSRLAINRFVRSFEKIEARI